MGNDWINVELKDLSTHVIGGDWGKDPDFDDPEYDFAFCIRGAEFKNWKSEKGKTASLRKIKKSNLSKRTLVENDILIEISGGGPDQPVGRTVIIDKSVFLNLKDFPIVCTNFLRLFRPTPSINSKWINTFLEFFYRSGGTIPLQGGSNNLRNLKFQQFEEVNIPIPPLPVQRAIVARIEELFSELDHAVSSLQSAQAKLDIYRQAVLKKAFEGGFTDLNLEWRNVEFGALIKSIDAGKSFRCDERPPKKDEVGVLKVSAVTWGEFLEEESKTVTDPSMINEAYFVQKGDFLLSRANTIELVGNSVIVKGISKSLMLSDKTLRINIDNTLAKDFYILYFLRSREGKKQIQQLSSGNQESMRNIGQSRIKQILIPIPPNLKEQTQIVQEIESRLSVADKLAETIQTNLQKSEALRQSILKKAFEGRLLSEAELEACRKEADWEPAERLLERIKSEKSKVKKS